METVKTAEEFIARGNYKKALDIFQHIADDDPHNALAFQGIAQGHYGLGKFDEAVIACHEALRNNPQLAIPHTILAYVHYYANNYEESLLEAQKAFSISPDSAKVLECYGTILLADGKIDVAIPFLEDALKKEPTLLSARNNLAVAYGQKGKYEKHFIGMKEVFRLKPSMKNGIRLLSAFQRRYALAIQ